MIENKIPGPDDFEEEKEGGGIKRQKTRRKKKKEPEAETSELQQINGTLEQYIKTESNLTHNLLIKVLKPIAYYYPNQLINEVL